MGSHAARASHWGRCGRPRPPSRAGAHKPVRSTRPSRCVLRYHAHAELARRRSTLARDRHRSCNVPWCCCPNRPSRALRSAPRRRAERAPVRSCTQREDVRTRVQTFGRSYRCCARLAARRHLRPRRLQRRPLSSPRRPPCSSNLHPRRHRPRRRLSSRRRRPCRGWCSRGPPQESRRVARRFVGSSPRRRRGSSSSCAASVCARSPCTRS